ncbi:hypothetical protein O3P69_008794 [Scylla paramamosain]|uniref:Uncharacterized protein n=1 Tax=Scylla paramamosain TaxID=85552 RepID=A0AAW0TNK1_SCYPA
MNLPYFPPNVFSSLNRLKLIDLSHNSLKGNLVQGILRVPLDSVEEVRLNNNYISGITSTAITGVHRTATIDFSNNKIVALEWKDWYPLLDQLTGVEVVDLTNNKLQCSCDLVWLLLDKDELNKINSKTKCMNGTLIRDLNVDSLLIVC